MAIFRKSVLRVFGKKNPVATTNRFAASRRREAQFPEPYQITAQGRSGEARRPGAKKLEGLDRSAQMHTLPHSEGSVMETSSFRGQQRFIGEGLPETDRTFDGVFPLQTFAMGAHSIPSTEEMLGMAKVAIDRQPLSSDAPTEVLPVVRYLDTMPVWYDGVNYHLNP